MLEPGMRYQTITSNQVIIAYIKMLENIQYGLLAELENCEQDFRNLSANFSPCSDNHQIIVNCARRVRATIDKAKGV